MGTSFASMAINSTKPLVHLLCNCRHYDLLYYSQQCQQHVRNSSPCRQSSRPGQDSPLELRPPRDSILLDAAIDEARKRKEKRFSHMARMIAAGRGGFAAARAARQEAEDCIS